MPNISTEYEILIRDLHAALVENDGVENVTVLHNVKLNGRSGANHQIDVYWEFKVAGVKYKTCIECKHYNRRIKKPHVAAFITTIEDIGNTTGIFATTIGYQSGAVLLAKEKNIRLITVNHLLKSINLNLEILIPDTEIFDIKYDKHHAKRLLIEKNLTHFEMATRWNQLTTFFDAMGNPVSSLKKIINDSISSDGTGRIEPEELYDQTEIGLLRISEIHYRRTSQ